MKIGILMAGRFPLSDRPELGEYNVLYERMLSGHGFDFASYPVVELDFPKSVEECDGWLISGSRHGAYEDHAFIPLLEKFIRDAYTKNVPIVGICFGHQIIAQALGGKVEKFKGGWAVGPQTYDWPDGPAQLNAWHQDQVVELPSDAAPLASNEFCKYAALVYGERIFTTQAHPEFDSVAVAGLAEVRSPGKIPDHLVEAALEKSALPNDNARISNQIARFFKERSLS